MPKKGFDEEAEKRRIAAAEMADKVRKEEAARRQAEEEERIWREQEAKREAEEKRALEIHNSHFERYRRSGVIVHMISNGVGDREASELARALKEKVHIA
jgi:N-dimethylarginine dimethylaminohydrolase